MEVITTPHTREHTGILARMREDITTYIKRDPSARTRTSIIIGALGLHAVWAYRIYHWLWQKGFYGLSEFLARRARKRYGLEIHPAASIGRRFVIDHGLGIVIGETTRIGDDCLMYQGVTLGMTGKQTGKRHPTIGNNVTIGANAVILGAIHVADRANVGAGAVVTHDVPKDVSVAGVPATIISDRRLQKLGTKERENVLWSCAL